MQDKKEELLKKLEKHDWSHVFSDSLEAFVKGEESAKEIKTFARNNHLADFLDEWLKNKGREL